MKSRLITLMFYFAMIMFLVIQLPITNQITSASDQNNNTPGSLQSFDKAGKRQNCPLKHTDVKAEISGFLARVVVTQEFENPFTDKIEAIYTFPLSQNAAVDDMTMMVGNRTIRGEIKKRAEAQQIYTQARNSNHIASLLDQERPNIFTQSVANIMPGEQIKIVISYVETLNYHDGAYQFVFPMVVGPRYIPGNAIGNQADGFAHESDQVPDATRITANVTAPNTRAGHNISLEVSLDAGVPIERLTSTLHQVDIERSDDHRTVVRLKNRNEIPNKDFILKYDVAGSKITDALLLHRSKKGGYFTLIMQPPESVTAEDVTPKELVFVLDTSGSMSGFPIEKAKETMKMALAGLYPRDTFNLITFSGETEILFPKPVAATDDNLIKAQEFLDSHHSGGGTEMMTAIRTALAPSDSQQHIRIVCFMTDGFVGNDFEIIDEVKKHPNARVFSFGIGDSVNRYLLDNIAKAGRGEAEYITLQDDGTKAAVKFYQRIRNPLLTDISIDWGGLPISDVYPQRIPDMFSAKPLILTGRFNREGHGIIRLKGKLSGDDFTREINLDLPAEKINNRVISTLWARQRVEDLMNQDLTGIQQGNTTNYALQEEITKVGLEYHLLTQFTSFVAVDEGVVTDGSEARTVTVPVEMPSGVNGTDPNGAQSSISQGRLPLPNGIKSGGGGGGNHETTDKLPIVAPSAHPPAITNPGQNPPPTVLPTEPTIEIDPSLSANNLNTLPVGQPIGIPQPSNIPPPIPSDASGSAVSIGTCYGVGSGIGAGQSDGAGIGAGIGGRVGNGSNSSSKGIEKPVILGHMMIGGDGGNIRQDQFTAGGFVISNDLLSVAGTSINSDITLVGQSHSIPREHLNKFHLLILRYLMQSSEQQTPISSTLARYIKNDRINLAVELADSSPELIKLLQELGFKITIMPINNLIRGSLPLNQLTTLAQSDNVKTISPDDGNR